MGRRVDGRARRPGARSRSRGSRHCPRPRPGRRPVVPSARASARSAATSGSSPSGSEELPRSAPAGSARSEKGSARPTIVTGSPGSSRASPCTTAARRVAQPRRAGRVVRGSTVSSAAAAVSSSISVGRVEPPWRMSRPADASPSMSGSPSNRTGASNPAPRGKTRRLPGRIADPEPDRSLLRVAGSVAVGSPCRRRPWSGSRRRARSGGATPASARPVRRCR